MARGLIRAGSAVCAAAVRRRRTRRLAGWTGGQLGGLGWGRLAGWAAWGGWARPGREGRAEPGQPRLRGRKAGSAGNWIESRGVAAGRAARLAGWVRPGRAGRAEPSQLLLPLARNLDPAAPAWPSGLARCFSNAAGTVPGSNPGSAISARTPARGQGGQPEVDRGKFPLELAAAGAFLCKRRNPCIL